MSLIRTALRLQAIETLLAEPSLRDLLEGRVYDSRIGALDHREPVPVILVTTEETKGESWSSQNGGVPFGMTCDLVLEIAMNLIAGTPEEPIVAVVATDGELEAYLDLIEERATEALTVGETPAARLLRSAVHRRVPRVASSRFATDQTGEKLAIRLLTLTVDLQTDEPTAPLDAPTGAYAAFPAALRAVALAAAPYGSTRATCDRLDALLTTSPAERFTGAEMLFAPQPLEPASPPDRDADLAGGATIALPANP